jgi:hypothetical protein
VLPVLKYLIARIALFVAASAVLWFLGAGEVVALFGGLLVSLLLTYLLLGRLREPATAAIVDRVEGRTRRRAAREDEDALVEDALVEDALAEDRLAEDRRAEDRRAEDARRADVPAEGARSQEQ